MWSTVSRLVHGKLATLPLATVSVFVIEGSAVREYRVRVAVPSKTYVMLHAKTLGTRSPTAIGD